MKYKLLVVFYYRKLSDPGCESGFSNTVVEMDSRNLTEKDVRDIEDSLQFRMQYRTVSFLNAIWLDG